jgi:hypothetical protein
MTRVASLVFIAWCALGALTLSGIGCSSADAIKNNFTCHDVCQRYADCFNANYDVSGCEDRCKNTADDSNTKQGMLDDCHDCIGDKSCVGDIASCSSTCGNFVP